SSRSGAPASYVQLPVNGAGRPPPKPEPAVQPAGRSPAGSNVLPNTLVTKSTRNGVADAASGAQRTASRLVAAQRTAYPPGALPNRRPSPWVATVGQGVSFEDLRTSPGGPRSGASGAGTASPRTRTRRSRAGSSPRPPGRSGNTGETPRTGTPTPS